MSCSNDQETILSLSCKGKKCVDVRPELSGPVTVRLQLDAGCNCQTVPKKARVRTSTAISASADRSRTRRPAPPEGGGHIQAGTRQPSLFILQAADGLQYGQDQRLRERAPPDALEYDGGKRKVTKRPELFWEPRITAFER